MKTQPDSQPKPTVPRELTLGELDQAVLRALDGEVKAAKAAMLDAQEARQKAQLNFESRAQEIARKLGFNGMFQLVDLNRIREVL